MKTKIIKSILVPSLGILSVGVVTPITISSCANQQVQVPVESVRLNEAANANPIVLRKNEIKDLTTTILPNNATDKNLDWKSSDRDIARVVEVDNQTAKIITGNETGEAIITLSTSDGKIRNSYKIVVNPTFSDIPQTGSSIELNEGETEDLSQEWHDMTWKSSDETIAVIDKGNKIKALKPGKAIITGTNENGDEVVTFEVTVKPTVKVESIQLDKEKLVFTADEDHYQLTATISPENATNKKITWKSSDKKVAWVSPNGLVTPVPGGGTATITATTEDGGKTATCEVIVNWTRVENIQLDRKELELAVGQDSQLKATVLPENASYKKVTWKSYNKNVATVDPITGKVKAVSPGNVTIIAIAEDDNEKTAECVVNVVAKTVPIENVVKVESVQLDNSNLELTEGNQAQLKATVLPETATNKKVTWESSDNSIVTVENGLVKAVKAGKATITVTTVDGSKTATCEVDVIAKTVPVENVKVEKVQLDNSNLKLTEGNQAQLKATVLPETATNKNVTWKSSDENIATVDQTGLVKAVKAGKATITVTTEDGSITAKGEVNVIAKPESVQLNKKELKLVEGQTEQLTAKVMPEDATNKNVTWKSSDNNVATVDQNGLVTAVRDGIATISVTTKDGGKTDICDVIVGKKIAVESVMIEKLPYGLDLAEGETRQITAIVFPENATNKNVSWFSSDDKVATIDPTGLVRAISVGKTTITVVSEDNDRKIAKCEIRVTKFVPVDSIQLDYSNENIHLDNNNLKLLEGHKAQLKATVLPRNATNKNVKWVSSNPNVATVDQNGLVTAVSDGIATITVTAEDGSGKKATCKVTITAKTV